MPEAGPYSLATLSFLVFSLLSWQLRANTQQQAPPVTLSWFSGAVFIAAVARLFVGYVLDPARLPITERTTLFAFLFDGLLLLSFLALITLAVVWILVRAATADP